MKRNQRILKEFYVLTILIITCTLTANAQEIKPEESEVWKPVPEEVTPGQMGKAPSDAIILFNGEDLSAWQKTQFKGEPTTADGVEEMLGKWDSDFSHEEAQWIVEDGNIVVNPGSGGIETEQDFRDFQLHIEWMAPVDEGKEGQGYSNSGIFLMSLYEIQVLNSHGNNTYSNGQAGSIYKQHIPLVNASRPAGEWQAYDIVFTAPVFANNSRVEYPARITAFHNGVLIQNNVEIRGPTVFIGNPRYVEHPDKMPLRLQDHGNPVRYRNIWIRPLNEN